MNFEGALSVKAVLLAQRREIQEILIDEKKKDRDIAFIIAKARELNVKVTRKSRDEIDLLCTGKTHGGVVAVAGNRQYQTIESCFATELPFICILEGIEDPFNLGYALRTLYSAGCSGVVLANREWRHVENVIVKSSAGASEYIHIVLSDDISKDLQTCKDKGCISYAAMRKDAVPYFDENYNVPLVMAIGGEMRGLSTAVLTKVDKNIYIPYANDFRNALNASSAIAALSFEVVRQRRKNV